MILVDLYTPPPPVIIESYPVVVEQYYVPPPQSIYIVPHTIYPTVEYRKKIRTNNETIIIDRSVERYYPYYGCCYP